MKSLFIALALLLSLVATSASKDPCKGTTSKRLPCKSTMVMADGYCRMHSPNTPRCEAMTSKKTPCKMVVDKVGDKCKYHIDK